MVTIKHCVGFQNCFDCTISLRTKNNDSITGIYSVGIEKVSIIE